MLGTVLKDEEKIKQTIEELGLCKRDALKTTREKVNGWVVYSKISVLLLIWWLCRDFGGIFRELLPGNFAKLQPPDDQDLMDDLEIKVQLGGVWKQSLTELSGGQRCATLFSVFTHSSCLTSYIFKRWLIALLQFKPAPMYILDEIDAARPLAHSTHWHAIPHLLHTMVVAFLEAWRYVFGETVLGPIHGSG